MFFPQLIVGSFLIILTVIIHAVVLDRLIKRITILAPIMFDKTPRLWKVHILSMTVLCVFLAHVIQVIIWAVFYVAVNALPDFEEALYFSTSTFTTVGYGDVVLDKSWRLTSAFQSANGFIMFGWSTAFIFEVMSKLYKEETINKKSGRL